MKKQRYLQLEGLGLSRDDLSYQLSEINEDILKKNIIPKEVFRDYIKSKIIDEDLSVDDIDELRFKFLKVAGIQIPTHIGIYKLIYNLFIDYILLPDYVEGWQKEDIHKELDAIIDRVEGRAFRILDILNKRGFFNISLGNLDTLENELEGYGNEGGIVEYRVFEVGGVFGNIHMGIFSEDNEGGYKVKLPVRIPINTKVKVGEEEIKEKNISKKDIEEVLAKYLKKGKGSVWSVDEKALKSIKKDLNKYKGKKKNELLEKLDTLRKLKGFSFHTETQNNKNTLYSVDDASYYVITISNKDIKALSDTNYSVDEIVEKLNSIFDVLNILVNDIAVKSGVEHHKRYLNFASSTYYAADQGNEDDIDKSTIEKFSKMLIEMKEPVYLTDIGGQKEAKVEIRKIINSIKNEEIMKSWGARTTNGMVFEGPTGTGKTLLAQAIATEVNGEVYNIKLTDIASSAYINEGANNVKELFKFLRYKAKKTNKKIIVILDELDALFKKRNGDKNSGEDTKIVNTFLTEMSGFDDINNIIFIGTTNLIKDLDPAVIRSGRLSQTIKVDNPDKEAREQIFKIHIGKAKKKSIKAEKVFNGTDLSWLAEISDGLSGADIEEVIRQLVEMKANEEIETGKYSKITDDDFKNVINKVKKEIKEDKVMGFRVD